jgi:hypothetical protein
MTLLSRGQKTYDRLPHYWQHEGATVMRALIESLTSEIELDQTLDDIYKAHTIEHAVGRSLDFIAANVGVVRLPQESDFWLRERVKFWIYVQNSSATLPEIKRALAWYIGIAFKNENWESEILTQIKVYVGKSKHWPYEEDMPDYVEAEIPWKVIDLWRSDSWMMGSRTGDFPWQAGRNTGKRSLHGHHLILELLDLLEILVPMNTKARIWGRGWHFGSNTGTFPWQTMSLQDTRLGGPVEVRGTNYLRDLVTEPEGALTVNENKAGSYLKRGIMVPLILSRLAGKRVFRYGAEAKERGIRVWP